LKGVLKEEHLLKGPLKGSLTVFKELLKGSLKVFLLLKGLLKGFFLKGL